MRTLNQHSLTSRVISLISGLLFMIVVLSGGTATAQQVNKIQQTIDALKATYDSKDQDYLTDGNRVVWVKSYKRWEPDDMSVIEKEAPHVLVFLNQAIQHNRYDVLEQLLPDYYRAHGGAKAFAADVMKQQETVQTNAAKEKS